MVLSVEEVARLLDAAPGLKYKAALSAAYGAGLRANQVVSLKIADIDRITVTVQASTVTVIPPHGGIPCDPHSVLSG